MIAGRRSINSLSYSYLPSTVSLLRPHMRFRFLTIALVILIPAWLAFADAQQKDAKDKDYAAELPRIPVVAFKSHLGHTLGDRKDADAPPGKGGPFTC